MRYYKLKSDFTKKEKRDFVINNILELRKGMRAKIPEKNLDKNLLIATWNIRDFDSNKFGHGPRLKESFYYIAEIISAFDLVAVQEVNKDLRAFNRLMYLLGPDWDFITTDVTEGKGGNSERMTFIYDVRRVSFKNIAGEIVLPKTRLIRGDIQFARTPFVVSFQAGWTKFNLCTVHIYFGSDYGDKMERRKSEIAGIAKFLKSRADKNKENLIVLGDFNITEPEHETMKALTNNGFRIPDQIKERPVGTNTWQSKHYDQIGIRSKTKYFQMGDEPNSAGAFFFYEHVLTEDQFDDYKEHAAASLTKQKLNKEKDLAREENKANPDPKKIEKLKKAINEFNDEINNPVKLKDYYYRLWKTFQVSDHMPMWTELIVDHSEKYLKNI